MTAIRQSFVYQLEDGLAEGKSSGLGWLQPPPGSFFDFTPTRQTNAIYGAGDKKRQAVVYGKFSGTWNWTYMFDYNYLGPLMLAFEEVNEKKWGDSGFGQKDGNGHFVFKKINNKRVPSFTVRGKILNTMVNAEADDELYEVLGCFTQTISFARSSSTSQYQVTLSGVFVDMQSVLGELDGLDYKAYSPSLAEYSCLFQGDGVDDATYVANTESLSISVGNNADAEYNVCSGFATVYHEGYTQIQFSTTMYSANPKKWKMRQYSGGKDDIHRRPMAKNLGPLETVTVASYDKSQRDDGYVTYESAYEASDNSILFTISNAVIKSVKYPNGDGSRLLDSVSSVDCSDIVIDVKTEGETNGLTVTNTITSAPIVAPSDDPYTFTVANPASGEDYEFTMPQEYTASVLLYKKLIVNTAVPSDDQKLEKGYLTVAGDATGTPSVVLENLLIRPLREVTGITVENDSTLETDQKNTILITGTPTVVETGYYFIVNPDTDAKGVLRIDVRSS